MTEYRPGDVANWHVLSITGEWVPFRHREPNAQPPWYAGDVVNGHVFNGKSWTMIPAPPKRSKGKSLFTVTAVGVATILAVGLTIGQVEESQTVGPGAQAEFNSIVREGQGTETTNDMQVVQAKQHRGDKLCNLMPSRRVEGWVGTVNMATTELFNDDGELNLTVGRNIHIRGENIDPDSALFKQLSSVTEGDEVTFSGTFNEGDHCIEEESLFSSNGLRKPTFVIEFTSIGGNE